MLNNEIPKLIHYCWFGKTAKPKLVQDCIASWKVHFDGYEVVEWNEVNYTSEHPFFLSAIDKKMWAFASDYARLDILQQYGGIYLDTDLLIIKPFTDLLTNKVNIGAESIEYVNGAFIATCKKHSYIADCLSYYDEVIVSSTEDQFLMQITIPIIMTKILFEKYIHKIRFDKIIDENEIRILPTEYFYPLPYLERHNLNNYTGYLRDSSVAVHLWSASWKKYSALYYFEHKQYFNGFYELIQEIKNDKITLNKKYVKKLLKVIFNIHI
jgi:mannosyltransferase OCH1-like enzyme